MDFAKEKTEAVITRTIAALADNGVSAELVQTKEEAKAKVLSLIPKGAEVMTMTSITLHETGIDTALNESGEYDSVKHKLSDMDRATQNLEMQRIGAAPDWAVGSVHAITENGHVLIASNTGSQLPAYAYGSPHVIWVVGVQKIVKTVDEGMTRIQEYIVPKETMRAREAYNLPEFNTNVSKLLVLNREVKPGRIHIVFVNESLGF